MLRINGFLSLMRTRGLINLILSMRPTLMNEKPNHRRAATLSREAYGVRPAFRGFWRQIDYVRTTAPASRSHSIRFAPNHGKLRAISMMTMQRTQRRPFE